MTATFPPPPDPPKTSEEDPSIKKDRRIQSWVFHVIGAGSVAVQFFVKTVPNPTIIILSGLIGGSPLMYQIWESYIKGKK